MALISLSDVTEKLGVPRAARGCRFVMGSCWLLRVLVVCLFAFVFGWLVPFLMLPHECGLSRVLCISVSFEKTNLRVIESTTEGGGYGQFLSKSLSTQEVGKGMERVP